MLARIIYTSTAQKSKLSLWTQSPLIQKYAASIAVGRYENALSIRSDGLKSDWSVILYVEFVKSSVATPLNVEDLTLIFSGFLSTINLYNFKEIKKNRYDEFLN